MKPSKNKASATSYNNGLKDLVRQPHPDPRLSEAWNKIATAKTTLRRIERRLDDYQEPQQVALSYDQFSSQSTGGASGARKVSRLDDKFNDIRTATRQPLSPVSPNLRHSPSANQQRQRYSPSTNQKRVSFSDSPPLVNDGQKGAEPHRLGGAFPNAPDFSPIKSDDRANSDDVINLTDSRAIRETEIRFLNDDVFQVVGTLVFVDNGPRGQGRLDIGQGQPELGQKKGLLEVDSEGLSRIKLLIDEQRRQLESNRLRAAMDREEEERQMASRQRHHDDDVIVPASREVWAREPVQVMTRKVAQGPPAPHYLGFNEPETRYRHPPEPSTSKHKDQTKPKPTKPTLEKRPSASKPAKTEPAKPKPEVSKPDASKPKPQPDVRPKTKPETDEKSSRAVKKPVKHVGLITTTSWREGQKLILQELGPMPKLKEEKDENREDRKEDHKEERTEDRPLPDDLRGVLDDLKLDHRPPPPEIGGSPRAPPVTPPTRRTPPKRKLRPPTEKEAPAPPKVRHYDSEEMRKYIVKQQADRKKKQQEEKNAKQLAEEKRKKQLADLAAKSKSSCKPRPQSQFGSVRGLDETFSKEPTVTSKQFISVDLEGAGEDDDSDTLTDHSQNDDEGPSGADLAIPGVSPDVQEIIKEYRQSVRASRDFKPRDHAAKPRPQTAGARPQEAGQTGARAAQNTEPSANQGGRTKSQRLAALKQTATSLQARLDDEMGRLLEANFSPPGVSSTPRRPPEAVLQSQASKPLYTMEGAYPGKGLQGSAPDVRRGPGYQSRPERGSRKLQQPFDTDLPGVNRLRKAVSNDELGQSPPRPSRLVRGPVLEDERDESGESLLESDLDLSEHINRKINQILQEETGGTTTKPSSKPKPQFTVPDKVGPLYSKKAPPKKGSPKVESPLTKQELFEMENDPYTVLNMFRRQQRRNKGAKREPSARSQSPLDPSQRSQSAGIPGYHRSHSPLEPRSQSASGSVESLPGKGQSASGRRSHVSGRSQSARSYDDTFEEGDSTIAESESESFPKNGSGVPSLERERAGRGQKKHSAPSSRAESIKADKSAPSYRGAPHPPPHGGAPHAPTDDPFTIGATAGPTYAAGAPYSAHGGPYRHDHQSVGPGGPYQQGGVHLQGAHPYRPRVQRLYEEDGRLSPGSLERQMAAELYKLDGVEESVRQLTDVERARAVSLAQQETVSLAQVLKARQQSHERELTSLQLKARQEAIDAGQSALDQARRVMDRNSERLTTDLSADRQAVLEAQQASARLLQAQTEAANLTADAAKQIHQVRATMLEQATLPVDESIRLATQTAQAAATGAVRAALREQGKGKERSSRSRQRSPPTTRTSTCSDYTDSRSAPDTRSAPDSRSAPESKSSSKTSSKTGSTRVAATKARDSNRDSIPEDLVTNDDDDRTPHASDNEDTIRTEEGATEQEPETISEDLHSEKVEEYSLSFDETMTEDEREDQSFRMLLPSEEHRRQAKRDRSASASRERSVEKRAAVEVRSRDSSKGAKKDKIPSVSSDEVSVSRGDETVPLVAEDSFNKFTAALVHQYMKEEEVRAQHQVALLKLREKALKEKTKAEMAWLEQQKKRCRDKGADDIYPQIRKKQRGLIIKLQQEQAEIKRLRQANALATKERQLLLYQQQEINRLRQSAIQTREKMKHSVSLHASDLGAETGDETSLALDDQSEMSERLEVSAPAKGKEKDYKSDSEVYDASLRIPSSPDAKAMQKLKKMKMDPKYLTTREKRLSSRRKQAESLLQWKHRLDQEEREIQKMELKALNAQDDQGRKAVKQPLIASSRNEPKSTKPMKAKPLTPRDDETESSIAEEISEKNETETEIKTSSAVKRNHQESGDEATLVSTTSVRDQSYSNDTFISEHTKPTATGLSHSASAPAALRPAQSGHGSAHSSLAALREKTNRPLFASDKSLTPRSPRGVRRRETESESEDSLSCAPSVSETASVSDASDIELRIRALNEELRRRRSEADRLKREQKKKRKDRLKAQEASLKKQLEAYDNFISQTKANLQKELELEPSKSTVKPQIKQPKVHSDARRLKDALSRTPEAARPISGSDTAGSQSEGSSRSGSFDDVIVAEKESPRVPKEVEKIESPRKDEEELAQVEVVGVEEKPKEREVSKEDEGAESDTSGSTVKSEKSVLESPRKVAEKTVEPETRKSESEIVTESIADESLSEFQKLDLNEDSEPPKLDLGDMKLDLEVPKLDLDQNLEQRAELDLGGQDTARTVSSEILDESPRLENQIETRSVDDVVIPPLDLKEDRWPINEQKTEQENGGDQSARSFQSSYSDDYSDDFSSDRGEKDSNIKRSISLDNQELKEAISLDKDDISKRTTSITDDVSKRTTSVTDDVSEHLSYQESESEGSEQHVLDNFEIKFELQPSEKSESSEKHQKSEISEKSELFHVPKIPVIEADEISEDIHEISVKSEISEVAHKTEEVKDAEFKVGDRVLIGGVKAGTIKYQGPFKFAPGHWLGIELDRPEGTNDGTVGGQTYFTAKPRHGIFAPEEKVTLYKDDKADLSKTTPRFVSVFEKPAAQGQVDSSQQQQQISTPRELELSDFAQLSQDEKREVVLRSLRQDEDEDEISEISISSDLERAISMAAQNVEQFSPRKSQQSQQDLDSLVEKITSNLASSVLNDSVGVMKEIRDKSPEAKTKAKLSQEELISDESKPELIEGVEEDVGIASDVATKGLLDDAIDHMLLVRKRRQEASDQVSVHSSDQDSGIHGEHERRLTPASSVVSNESAVESLEGEPRRPTSPVEAAAHKGRTPADLAEVARMLDHDLFDLEATPAHEDGWMDDDLGLGKREPPPPYPGSPPPSGKPRPELLALQRLADEVLYAVPHKAQAVTNLVSKVVDVFWEARRYGDQLDDVTMPDDYVNDDELGAEDSVDLESKSRRCYKRMIFDLVGEHIKEMYQNELCDEPSPAWVKHKLQPGSRLYRGRSPPTTSEGLKEVLNERILRILNLAPSSTKERSKWQPSRKKNDHVDEILVEELREEETEWVDYDDDEMAVKMQLTDAIFELLMQETVDVLGDIQTKVTKRASLES